MTVFLALMVIGLTGLIMMAIPGFSRHGHGVGAHGADHAGHIPGHAGQGAIHAGAGHAGHAPAPAHAQGTHAPPPGQEATGNGRLGGTRWIPPLYAVFSFLALYGAAGYILAAYHLPISWAAIIALVPSALLVRFGVVPFWNMLFQFQGKPDTPLEELILCDAQAVTAFHNGRGIVEVVRDGRQVQFSARLPEAQAALPVRVGDKLRVEEVDAANERLIVSLH
ncbi:MAG TPA: hypothetical protein VKU00_27890 [Chthonomonadaceae bacterium]|nr:hypothetical protein [Chthonomonadaceae bacterium]